MGRRPKYPPGHAKHRVNLAVFPRGFSNLVVRASKVLGLQPRTWCYAVLAREAVATLVAAQHRPLRVNVGGRIWCLEKDGTWRVAVVSDGTEQVMIQDQVGGLPAMISLDGVGVSCYWIGHGDGYVVPYDDLGWMGRAPDAQSVRSFFRNLFSPGGEDSDAKIDPVLRAGLAGPDFVREDPGGPLPPRDPAEPPGDGAGRAPEEPAPGSTAAPHAPADPGTHRVELELDPGP